MKFAKDRSELSNEAIRCRGLGHSWVPSTAVVANTKEFKGYNVTLVCVNGCGTAKHFMLSQRGEYYPATYSYGDDYILAKGNPYISREDRGLFKLQALTDILPEKQDEVIHMRPYKKRA